MFVKKSGSEMLSVSEPMAPTGNGTFSLIGGDVAIKGDIAASADLRVDGRVEGDIACTSLVQGEGSTITGTVTAHTARLAGTIKGSINARELTVLGTARIEGDVQYDALTIEQGAQVEGRFSHRIPAEAMGKDSAATGESGPATGGEPQLTLAS